MNPENFKCGLVAIVGRPNVGKSTLLNKMLGQKLSITSRKPQTTRHQILGISTTDEAQYVFIDTPGINKITDNAMHRYLNHSAKTILHDVDVILFVVDRRKWTENDENVLALCVQSKKPIIVVMNKIDLLDSKADVLPILKTLSERGTFSDIVPVSAKNYKQTEQLLGAIVKHLPVNEPMYDSDELTDRSSRFIAAEFIREKLMRLLGDELPYATTVEIEKYEDTDKILRIYAIIWVENNNQKKIVIGKNGESLKKIGYTARLDLEKFFDKKVYLETWVKVKSGWSNDEKALQQLGYRDEF